MKQTCKSECFSVPPRNFLEQVLYNGPFHRGITSKNTMLSEKCHYRPQWPILTDVDREEAVVVAELVLSHTKETKSYFPR